MKATQITLLPFGLLVCLFSVSTLTVLYRWDGIFGRVIANSHTYSISFLVAVGILCLLASRLKTIGRNSFLTAAFACVWIPWLGTVLSYWLMTVTWDLKSAFQLLQFEEFATTLAMSLFVPYIGACAWVSTLCGFLFLVVLTVFKKRHIA